VIVYIVFFFLFIVALLRYVPVLRVPNASPWLMPVGFVVKMLVGCFFLYIYSYHYGVGELTDDACAFLHDSKILNDTFQKSPIDYFKFLFGLDDRALISQYLSETTQWDAGSSKWFNDAKNVVRVHSLIHFFSFGREIIHLMVMVLISLLGLRLMTIAILPFVKVSSTVVVLSLLLMPNVLFWSSGILKEPLIFFSMGLFLYAVLGTFTPIRKIILVLLSITSLIGIKPYILLCVVLALISLFVFRSIKKVKIAFIVLIILISGSLLSLLTPPLKPVVNKLSDQQFDFINIGKGGVFARADTCIFIIYGADMPHVIINDVDSTVILTRQVIGDYIKPNVKKNKKSCTIYPNATPWKLYYDGVFSGSYITTTPIEGSSQTLLFNIPEAVNNVIFRPYPNDPPKSLYKYLTIFDGWGLLLFLVITFLFFRREISRKELNLIVVLLVFSLILTLLIGWTTPVIGAIIRYKVPVQLAMMLVTLILFNPKKIKK
jgi:hypothetical protein